MSDSSTAPVPGWHEDVKVVRETVSGLVREDDVVVVMHFTGSISGRDVLEGLDKQSCMSKGLKGGVIRLVYISSFLFREGICHIVLRNRIPGDAPDPPARVGTMALNHAKEAFYQDVDDETVAELAKDLVPLRVDFIWYRITNAAWRDTPPRTSCV
ncbi:hypothetical protein Daus18300_006357 [Diaporthe australafricana]|uniref:NAD(P)-binding domain-containing protein n=1 Tax=Diaporthe australafricana TaxID=127596 RepID=A0ABR3WV11_9PEZI